MSFINRLEKADFQIFVRVLFAYYNFESQVNLHKVEYIKSDIYLLSFTVESEKRQFLSSDQNFKMLGLRKHCQKYGLEEEQFKQQLKLEWQGFMVAKFGVEYISAKMLFKPSQTQIFKLTDKYSKALNYAKTNKQNFGNIKQES